MSVHFAILQSLPYIYKLPTNLKVHYFHTRMLIVSLSDITFKDSLWTENIFTVLRPFSVLVDNYLGSVAVKASLCSLHSKCLYHLFTVIPLTTYNIRHTFLLFYPVCLLIQLRDHIIFTYAVEIYCLLYSKTFIVVLTLFHIHEELLNVILYLTSCRR